MSTTNVIYASQLSGDEVGARVRFKYATAHIEDNIIEILHVRQGAEKVAFVRVSTLTPPSLIAIPGDYSGYFRLRHNEQVELL